MKKEKPDKYCSVELSHFSAKSLEEVEEQIRKLKEKNITPFDEVWVYIFWGRNCNDRDRCQPCIFRRKKKKPENPHNSNQ